MTEIARLSRTQEDSILHPFLLSLTLPLALDPKYRSVFSKYLRTLDHWIVYSMSSLSFIHIHMNQYVYVWKINAG